MKISRVVVGILQTNCYLIEKENQVIVVDPGGEIEKIKRKIGDKKVLAIFVTHYHFDHIGALSSLQSLYNVSVYDFKRGEKKYQIGPFAFEIIETKGHSEDSVTFYFEEEKTMFCGDFIFKDNIGRCDLKGGNYQKMLESIQKIKKYTDIKLYPGHDEETTLEYEKQNNENFK